VSEEIIARLVMNYFLHRGIKNSDITNLSFELNEANGKYFLDIKSTIVLATKGQLIRKEAGNRNLIIVFLVSLSVMVALALVGMLLPDAVLGRTLVYLSEFPAILVNIISTRYIIRNIS
jgi:hypothetical protein